MYFLSKVMVKSASCRPNNKPLMFVILGRSCVDKINWSMSNMILLKAMAKKKETDGQIIFAILFRRTAYLLSAYSDLFSLTEHY